MGVMQTIPMPIGSMFSAGDASTIPADAVRSLRNYLARPNRWDGRPPFVYDTLMSVMGLARWEDLTNQRTSTMAFDATKIYKKPTTGLAWDAGTSATFGTRLTDFTNIYGTMYAMFDDGAGLPSAAFSYDGTNVSATPFNTPIFGRCITAYGERVFIAYSRVTVTNNLGATKAYIATGGNWSLANVTAENITAGSTTTGRLTPTNATTAYIYTTADSVVALAAPARRVYLCQLQAVSATYDMPVTISLRLRRAWETLDGFTGGGLVTPSASNGFRYRAQSTGTTGGAEPTWPTTIGATVVDGTITWICDAPSTLGFVETFVGNATSFPDFISIYVPAELPPTPDDYLLECVIAFGNSTTATYTLAPLNFSYRDDKADNDPAKKCRGQQVTTGDFYFPFFNVEDSAASTQNLDYVIWSEPGQPAKILAKNTFPITEVPGFATAATTLSNRYIVFKRRGMWVFALTGNKNEVILPERATNEEIGCIGPRALDKFMNELFWIGENECYRMKIDGNPEPFCGPGMREEIMSKGAGWVESAATYKQPLLAIDRANKEVWVYAQAGKIYVFNLEANTWSYIDVSGSPPVRSMIFDTIGQRMLVSFGGFGVTRHMETSAAKDTIDTGSALTITNDIVFKPLELYAPRYEASLEEIGIFHLATASQAGQTITPSYSLDRGATYTTPTPYASGATVDITQPRVPLPIGTLGPSVTVKLSRSGFGGATNWSISKADATLELLRGELPYANAT